MTVGDGCDGIFDSGGGIKITVTTVTYRHGEDGICLLYTSDAADE